VDWSKTQAYALASRGYLNMKGREGRGIVEEGTDAGACARFATDQHPTRARSAAINSISRRELIQAHQLDAPDLLVNYRAAFACRGRPRWAACRGDFRRQPAALGSDTLLIEIVPGVLFSRPGRLHCPAISGTWRRLIQIFSDSQAPRMERESLL
jgi:hypothetical protein